MKMQNERTLYGGIKALRPNDRSSKLVWNGFSVSSSDGYIFFSQKNDNNHNTSVHINDDDNSSASFWSLCDSEDEEFASKNKQFFRLHVRLSYADYVEFCSAVEKLSILLHQKNIQQFKIVSQAHAPELREDEFHHSKSVTVYLEDMKAEDVVSLVKAIEVFVSENNITLEGQPITGYTHRVEFVHPEYNAVSIAPYRKFVPALSSYYLELINQLFNEGWKPGSPVSFAQCSEWVKLFAMAKSSDDESIAESVDVEPSVSDSGSIPESIHVASSDSAFIPPSIAEFIAESVDNEFISESIHVASSDSGSIPESIAESVDDESSDDESSVIDNESIPESIHVASSDAKTKGYLSDVGVSSVSFFSGSQDTQQTETPRSGESQVAKPV